MILGIKSNLSSFNAMYGEFKDSAWNERRSYGIVSALYGYGFGSLWLSGIWMFFKEYTIMKYLFC